MLIHNSRGRGLGGGGGASLIARTGMFGANYEKTLKRYLTVDF